MRWLNGITNSMDVNLSKLREIVKDRGAWRTAVHGVAKSQTLDYSLSGSSSLEISQARILEWVAIFSSRGFP